MFVLTSCRIRVPSFKLSLTSSLITKKDNFIRIWRGHIESLCYDLIKTTKNIFFVIPIAKVRFSRDVMGVNRLISD